MLHWITSGQSPLEHAVLKPMFEARKRVFVDLLGWDVPVIDGRFELDGFDTPDARYCVLTGEGGIHLASARLLPTARPHILDSLFPRLVQGPIPRGREIFEITRFCLDRSLRARQRRELRNQLVSALTRFALGYGIARYTGVAERPWLDQVRQFGWDCRLLGPLRRCGTAQLGAIAIEIGAETPDRLARCGIWVESEGLAHGI